MTTNMIPVFLEAGDQRIDLPERFRVGVGWRPGDLSVEPDLDVSVFLLDAFDKLPDSDFLVFYNNLQSPDGALSYSGDPQYIRESGQDQKTLELDLSRIDRRVHSLLIVVTVHQAEEYQHHFGMIDKAYIRLIDPQNQEEILRYTLHDDFAGETGIAVARFLRVAEGWRFEALGNVQAGGLKAFVAQYN